MSVRNSGSLEQISQKLLSFKGRPRDMNTFPLTEEEIWYLIDRVTKDLQRNKALIEIEAPVAICGDTHGQYSDVLRLFNHGGSIRYVFLGDYVDRGPYSIETMCIMFVYKAMFPNDFFILRGNHETAAINRVYGFYEECQRRYSIRLWHHFQTAFDSIPVAGLISGRIFCMHGGLSPDLHNFDQLRRMALPFEVPDIGGFVPSSRGVSYTFGEDVVTAFCQKHNIDLICRAHQVVENGYEFFANRKLLTIFSAPAYCGEFDNSGGMLAVDENLKCKLRRLKPANRRRRSQKTLLSGRV